MKKKIIIFGILISILSVGFIQFKINQNKTKEDVITPIVPGIKSEITGKLPINFSIGSDMFNFPSRLPYLVSENQVITKRSIEELAQKLNIINPIEEFEDINEGIKFYSSNDQDFIIATPKNSQIKYGKNTLNQTNTDFGLNEERIKILASDFVNQNGFDPYNQLTISDITYLKENPNSEGLQKTDKNNAIVAQVNFSLKTNNYKVINTYSSNPTTYLQITSDEEVYYFETVLKKSFSNSIEEYPIKNYQDVQNSINQAKLIDIQGNYVSLSDLNHSQILTININSIDIAYLLEENQEQNLQPVFILEGSIQIRGLDSNTTTLLLPAFK